MNELETRYEPLNIEDKWYQHWLDKRYFESVPDDREPYTVVIPPPNVTGVLHMGHMLNNTIQDVLIRRARMMGKNACWIPGTDHASIATEAKVVALLQEKGISKKDISREDFLQHAYEWKDKYGGIILQQLKKLGASCAWDRTAFTMDKEYYSEVIKVFCDLYHEGMIYRGIRMVNWDPQARTAVSDEEVIYKETNGHLCYLKYEIQHSNEYLVVATTRPETIMGDVAIAVHPDDERYKHLHGKNVIIPLVNRAIPIITDTILDIEFGTGCLKVTPAHDITDYEIGIRHNLPIIDVFNEDGTIADIAGIYVGEDRFIVRKKIIKALQEIDAIEKLEPYKNSVGYSERTQAAIEPRLSMQWFLKMKDISKPALDAIINEEVKLFPNKYVNTYKYWMENVRDWCLSRQLWWGQRIPAYYIGDSQDYVVAENESIALELAKSKTGNKDLTPNDLRQDEDVLDTWASSWLWPISVFGGINNPENPDFKYYYPTNDLVTAPEILFFWVARMIIAGKKYTQQAPFKNVYLTGIVRDKLGRKMSKSLGNSPDPIELIAKYSADGVRMGMLLCSPAGNDLPFDEKHCEQGRNFCNKLWNALRLLKSWQVNDTAELEMYLPATEWLEAKIQKTEEDIAQLITDFRLSEALMTLYNFVWDDFCSWYLEWIKPKQGEAVHEKIFNKTIDFFEQIIALLHPFMPFITEEIYHQLRERKDGDDLIIYQYKAPKKYNTQHLLQGEKIKELFSLLRNARSAAQLSPKHTAKINILCENKDVYLRFEKLIFEKASIESLNFDRPENEQISSFLIQKDTIYIDLGLTIDIAAEKQKINDEIKYYEGFVASVKSKLDNDKFIQFAKSEVIEKEKQKLEDGLSKINSLKGMLAKL
jgi:valyl-tRNA synthetase